LIIHSSGSIVVPFKQLLKSQDFGISVTTLLYFASSWLGLFLSFDQGFFFAICPATGVGIALILIFGKRSWPGIAIGAVIANTLVLSVKLQADVVAVLAFSVSLSAVNVAEVLAGRLLIIRFIAGGHPFSRAIHAFRFVFIAAAIALMTPLAGTILFWAGGFINTDQLDLHAGSWYLAVFNGVLVFTVWITAATRPLDVRWNKKKFAEGVLFLVLIVGIVLLMDFPAIMPVLERSFPFLVIPFLLWMAFSFSVQMASTGILVASMAAVWYTIRGHGPFVMEGQPQTLLLLEVFIAIVALTTLVLTSTVRERQEAQSTIQHFNETLETRIRERTRELKAEIESRRKAENEMRASNAVLRKTNKELDSFVYSVSHDLRAPIASVKGLLHLMKRERASKNVREYVDMIERRIDQQDVFIQEILDLSRNARLGLEQDPVVFESLLEEVFRQLQYFSHANKMEKEVRIDQAQPFICDYKRIKVIMNNLISNAMRYTNGKKPKITISASVSEETASIIVQDNGIGIDKEHLDKVFDMFYRATDTNAGSGLGLYIVKETIDKLGGQIDLSSTKGKGTEVRIVLPTTRAAADAEPIATDALEA
jgi:signal transduction histidine kinase